MKLNSARQAWHDAYYQPWDSQGAFIEKLGLLGAMVQRTERVRSASHAAHSAMAGQIQAVVSRLHSQLQAFGAFMYAPQCDDDTQEVAEEAVFNLAVSKSPRMTAAKRERCRYVAKGVMHRYRRMHQGGQSSTPDPLATPEAFKNWLEDWHGVRLPSCAWARDWEPFVQACFEACEDIDKKALGPVAAVMYRMKEAA